MQSTSLRTHCSPRRGKLLQQSISFRSTATWQEGRAVIFLTDAGSAPELPNVATSGDSPRQSHKPVDKRHKLCYGVSHGTRITPYTIMAAPSTPRLVRGTRIQDVGRASQETGEDARIGAARTTVAVKPQECSPSPLPHTASPIRRGWHSLGICRR